MPVQYIIEEWDFRDLVLQMKPPVLIPRPETEDLITHITNHINVHDVTHPNKILDIGCGSGPIVLSLAQEFPRSFCIAIDKCKIACELTTKNANNYALSNVYVEELELTDETVAGKIWLQLPPQFLLSCLIWLLYRIHRLCNIRTCTPFCFFQLVIHLSQPMI